MGISPLLTSGREDFAERVSEHGLFVGSVEEPRPVRAAYSAAGVLVAR